MGLLPHAEAMNWLELILYVGLNIHLYMSPFITKYKLALSLLFIFIALILKIFAQRLILSTMLLLRDANFFNLSKESTIL